MGTAYALMNYCSLQLQGALFVQFSIVTGREKHQKRNCAIIDSNWKRKASKNKSCNCWLQFEEKSIKENDIKRVMSSGCTHTWARTDCLCSVIKQHQKTKAKHMLETSTTMRHIYIYYNSNVKTPWFFFSFMCVHGKKIFQAFLT